MRPFAPLVLLALVGLVPASAAQYDMPPEVLEWAITDGVPLDLDDPATLDALNDVSASITGQSIHDCVEGITMDVPYNYRVMGTPTQQQFLEKYGSVFSDLGLLSALDEFTEGGPGVVDPPEQLQGGVNLIGILPGQNTTKWVVIGGHYDTREFTFGGGALDNAAGICTVLELAKAYKAHADAHGPLDATVVFVWYDGEEWGLYGSTAFANDPSVAMELLELEPHQAPQILVSQSYDMPGLNYPAKNYWIEYGEQTTLDEYAVLNLRTAPIHDGEEWTCWSYGCYEELKERADFLEILHRNINYQFLVREVAYDVLAFPPEYVWVYDDHYGRSDHIPLIAMGAAGMRIQGSHDREYPHYHQPTDSLPGLYALTGGTPDGIIAGFQAEAQAGGLTAFYVAKTGGLGHYGDVLYLNQTVTPERTVQEADDEAESPALALPFLLAAVLAVALLRRRSPGRP
jgi:hypothetical protein